MIADCLFCRMASGALAVPKLYEDELIFVIRDIQPRAPVHLLAVPKTHIANAQHIQPEHGPTLAALYHAAHVAARTEGIYDSGYRCAFNVLGDAGMTIHHLHLHVLGGRALGPEG